MVDWGFEGPYHAQDDIPQVRVPEGWHAWWLIGNPLGEPGVAEHFRPEFGPKYAREFPYRVREGAAALAMYNSYATHHAGVWARVPVVAGQEIRFSVWAHIWTGAGSGDPPVSDGDRYNYAVSVGIDPHGGTDPLSDEVIWSDELAYEAWDEYHQLSVSAVAQAAYVTVFTRGRCKWRVLHNDSYWDDARLEGSSSVQPPPLPPIGEIDYERLAAALDQVAAGYIAAARIVRGQDE